MDDHTHPQGEFPRQTAGPGYETRDTNVRAVVGFGIGLVISLVVVMGFLGILMTTWVRQREPLPPESAPTSVVQDLKRLRAEEEATLNGYGKVAGEPEFARIPIDRAMDLVAKKGVPFGKGQGRKTEVQINTRIKQ